MGIHYMRVARDQEIGGERFALVVETRHDHGIIARTAVHRQDMARRIGGVRFVVEGDTQELGHLSSTMTLKCLASRLPADGQKSLIICPQGIPKTNHERAAILAEHFRVVIAEDAGVIFGPDMNNPEAVMDLVAQDEDLLDHVTGLSESNGGIAIDKNGYTAYGLWYAVDTARARTARPLESATIQGWGAVGANAGRLLHTHGIAVVGASTCRGAITASNGAGLDVDALYDAWLRVGDECVFAGNLQSNGYRIHTDPDVLFTVPAQLFVPAARPSVLAMPDELAEVRVENPTVHDVTAFHRATGLAMVAEGANHPLTPRAEMYLEEQSVVVLPDYIVNCGGLIGCFFEWAYRRALFATPVLRSTIDTAARGYVCDVVRHNVQMLGQATQGARAAADRIVSANRDWLRVAMASHANLEEHEMARTLLAGGADTGQDQARGALLCA